jgi:hypothetical protein
MRPWPHNLRDRAEDTLEKGSEAGRLHPQDSRTRPT